MISSRSIDPLRAFFAGHSSFNGQFDVACSNNVLIVLIIPKCIIHFKFGDSNFSDFCPNRATTPIPCYLTLSSRSLPPRPHQRTRVTPRMCWRIYWTNCKHFPNNPVLIPRPMQRKSCKDHRAHCDRQTRPLLWPQPIPI